MRAFGHAPLLTELFYGLTSERVENFVSKFIIVEVNIFKGSDKPLEIYSWTTVNLILRLGQ